MENHSPPSWKELKSVQQFELALEDSMIKPALIFKYNSGNKESSEIRKRLEEEWSIDESDLDVFLLDESKSETLSAKVIEIAGVDAESPQVLLFADGVTMYDESHDMINVKKIKIALKIINRTFKWMESRA